MLPRSLPLRPHGLYGVVHVAALPGDPGHAATGFASTLDAAMADAEALVAGGCTGIVIENFGSTPFVKGTPGDRLPPHQVAALTVLATQCRSRFDVPIGVNCLRNDAPAAIGIAAAVDLAFVRVNVHVGAYLTDQGVIEGEAATTLRYRHALGADAVGIWADVMVKHAVPLAPIDPRVATRDCLLRGRADAVIVTGTATGAGVVRDDLEAIANAADGAPVVIGSGLTPDNAAELAPWVDAAIVGTYFKHEGDVRAPVDVERVRTMVAATAGTFKTPSRSARADNVG